MINMVMEPMYMRLGICPSCGAKLGTVERLKQKSGKTYKCSKCGKKMNEKYRMY